MAKKYYAVSKVQTFDDVVLTVNGNEIKPNVGPASDEPTGFLPVFDCYPCALDWADGDASMVLTFEEID